MFKGNVINEHNMKEAINLLDSMMRKFNRAEKHKIMKQATIDALIGTVANEFNFYTWKEMKERLLYRLPIIFSESKHMCIIKELAKRNVFDFENLILEVIDYAKERFINEYIDYMVDENVQEEEIVNYSILYASYFSTLKEELIKNRKLNCI